MSADVIQFHCSACQALLTVPSSMAGVSGPCPTCGQTVTSPQATAAPAPATSPFASQASTPAPEVAPPAPSPPSPPQGAPSLTSMLSGMRGGFPPASTPPPQAAPNPPASRGPVQPLPGSGAFQMNSGGSPPVHAPPQAAPENAPPPPFPGLGAAPSVPSQHPGLPGSPAPAASAPPAQAQAPAPWGASLPTATPPETPSSPGLGQTLLSGAPSQPAPWTQATPESAPSAPPQFPPQPQQAGGGFLPPKRAPGEPPQHSLPATPASVGGGHSAFGGTGGGPEAASMGPSQNSQLIPGRPTLPGFGPAPGAGAAAEPSSLLNRPNSAPMPAPATPAAGENPPDSASPTLPGGTQPSAQGHPPVRPHTTKRNSAKNSNMLMFALAVVFLAGSLGLIGWMFRDQVMPLVHMVIPPSQTEPATDIAAATPGTPTPAPSPISSEPTLATTATLSPPPEEAMDLELPDTKSASSPFDPTESVPRRALPATADEIASIQDAPPRMDMTGSVAIPPPVDEGPKVLPPLSESPEKTMLEVDSSQTQKAGTSTSQRNLSSQDDGPFTEVKGLTPVALPAAETLEKFLSSNDVAERLQYTLGADTMAPLMERYYTRAPDGPIVIDTVHMVRYDPTPQVGSGAHAVFGLGSQTWEYPIPVMLEETQDGWKVDWLAFVEFKDRLLEKFLETYQDGPARFHVGISRTHFFDDTVPNADSRHAFRVGPAPPNPFLKTVFLPKDSTLATQVKDTISWGAQVWAIVELQWRRMGGDQWVEVVAVPQLNWYSVPSVQATTAPIPETSARLDALPGSSSSSSPTGDGDIPKALPTGR